jgi:hypothetical protein
MNLATVGCRNRKTLKSEAAGGGKFFLFQRIWIFGSTVLYNVLTFIYLDYLYLYVKAFGNSIKLNF